MPFGIAGEKIGGGVFAALAPRGRFAPAGSLRGSPLLCLGFPIAPAGHFDFQERKFSVKCKLLLIFIASVCRPKKSARKVDDIG